MSNFPACGIYPHMSEDRYHAISKDNDGRPVLSKSFIKQMMISAVDGWEFLNSKFEPKAHHIYGQAMHAMALEGKEVFESRFYKGFDKRDFPNALDTVADLQGWLTSRGERITGKKDQLIDRVQKIDPNVEIIDCLKAKYEAGASDKIQLPHADYDEIESLSWVAETITLGKKAASEVSFFWFDADLQMNCKARLDLIGWCNDQMRVWDLKTFTNSRSKPIDKAIAGDIASYKYFIDASFYTRAVNQTPRALHGSQKSEDENAEWLAGFDYPEFWLLFVEKRQNPNIVPRQLVLNDGVSMTEYGQFADTAIRNAARGIKELAEDTGPEPWGRIHEPREIYLDEIPSYAFE